MGAGFLTSLPLAGVIAGSLVSGAAIDLILRWTGSRRLSRQGVGVASTLGAGTFLVAAQLMTDLAPAVAFITASAFCAGVSGPAGYTVTIDLAGKQVATLFSIMNMAGNLGATVCPLLVGALMEREEWAGVLLFLAGFYFAACVCWCFINVRGSIGGISMSTNANIRRPARWRTPTAIGLAVAAGVPVGLSVSASAVPFGPVLVGWFVALAGAVIVSAALCVLATHRYIIVGLAYAAGVAAAVVAASIAAFGIEGEWWRPPAQFVIVFMIVGFASLFGSLPCALLRWEHRRASQSTK
jgi:MFS family permease